MGKFGPVSGQAITLANSIIGVGILAMPFCFQQCGILLSVILLILSGFMSRSASHFLVKAAIKSRRRNFEVLAFYVFGNTGKFCVEIGIIGFLMGTCIAYFVVIGDLGPQIVAKLFGINYSNNLRAGIMVIISLSCILPLALLKNVDSLSNVCMITIVFYFCLVLKIIAEAANPMFSGEWLNSIEYWKPDGVLRCLPIFSMSLFCQTQLFEIYDMLPNASLEKMNAVTKNAVTICSVVYILVGFFGYIAFSSQSILGNILTNLSPTIMTEVIKMGFVLSLAFSFPLIIFPCRVSLYSLLYKKGQVGPHDLIGNMAPDSRFKYLTIFIIGITLLISLMLPNIEVVLGFIGSTIGVIICVIFPATCFICITIKNTNERVLAQIVLCFGIIIMVLGTYANLQATEIDNINAGYKLEIKQSKFNLENKVLKDFHHDTLKHKDGKKSDINKINNPHINQILETKDFRLEPPNPLPPKIIEIKDSRLEPPNPIPPKEDSVSKQEVPKTKIEQDDNKNSINAIDVQIIEPIKKKEILGTVENVKDIKLSVTELRTEKSELTMKTKMENDLKKQDLIETIKRHEQEQREIIQEQKEILNEIKKTKKEMEEGNMKKVVDNKLSETESKKLAVEHIQKLAKLAIESLGGKLDIITEKISVESKVKNVPTEKSLDKNASEKALDNSIIKQKDISKESHIHKIDEPESYKMGESIKQIKKSVSDIKLLEPILAVKPPIPIALAKPRENVAIVENTNRFDTKQEKKEVQDNTTDKNKPKDVSESEKNVVGGGKRDILQLHDKSSANQQEKVRFKRETENCDENSQNLIRADESVKDVDLKLSIMLSEPENVIRKQSSLNSENLSKQNFIKQSIVPD